ncbi:MAG: hypothetical protein R3B70_12120 [Polyangiaceae bacterium]
MISTRTSLSRGAVLAAAAACFALLPACAKPPEPQLVKAADVGKMGALAMDRPIVIEFEEGQKIPVELVLDGPFLKTPDDLPPVELIVRRHFFLRVDGNGIKSSADGKSFDEKPARPGSFAVGVDITREKGVRGKIRVRAPQPVGVDER